MKNALFISMLGEREHFRYENYVSLCSSGKEKDWVVDWHKSIAEESGYKFSGIDILIQNWNNLIDCHYSNFSDNLTT